MTRENNKKSGFTLIELSIVLVIIGLVVGGVLVGQDLIKSAQTRAQVSQFEKLNTAATTFRLKYNALPGDIQPADAASLGFFSMATNAAYAELGHGNIIDDIGNGTIGEQERHYYQGETAMFFRHLSEAELIEGSYGQSLDSLTANISTATAPASDGLPEAKIGDGNFISMLLDNGVSYYAVSQILSVRIGGGYHYRTTIARGMNAADAYNIDLKIDDGVATTGSVKPRYFDDDDDGMFVDIASYSDTPDCLDATESYNLTNTNRGCPLSVKVGF